MTALLAIWKFLRSKTGQVVGAALGVFAVVTLIWSRGRARGKVDQKLEQEKAEDAARAELRKVEAATAARATAREEKLVVELNANETRVMPRPRRAEDALAHAQESAARARGDREKDKP